MENRCLIRLYKGTERVGDSIDEKLWNYGYNTGNIVWYESVRTSLAWDEEILCDDEGKKQELQANYHKIIYVLPMANHINAYDGTLENVISFLLGKRHSDKIVALGLGAQLTKEYNTPKKLMDALPRERIDALKLLSEYSVSIGVRGEVTAECLEYIGVHNYRVIGCPSYYSNKEKIYQAVRNNKKIENISINLGAYGTRGIAQLLNILNAECMLKDSKYVMQELSDFPKTIYENSPVLSRHMKDRFPGINICAEEFTDFIKMNGYVFFDIRKWQHFFIHNKIDISVGARFHGNMIALLSGVPALWVVHDSRTTELCQCMKLPHIDVAELEKIKELDSLMKYLCYNQSFVLHYEKMYDNYMKFLEENNICFTGNIIDLGY